jgi:hydrogenase maturation protease
MWLVIGYGSQLHVDDRFGPAVAEAVQATADPTLVDVIVATQLTPELIEPISRAGGVIFVDAAIGGTPGRVECTSLGQTVAPAANSTALSHHCTPEMLLEGANALYGHAPPGWLYVAGGENFELGETLSPCVEQAVRETVARILLHIQDEPIPLQGVAPHQSGPTIPRG